MGDIAATVFLGKLDCYLHEESEKLLVLSKRVRKELMALRSKLTSIIPLLENPEDQQVIPLREAVYQVEDKVDQMMIFYCILALKKNRSWWCFPFPVLVLQCQIRSTFTDYSSAFNSLCHIAEADRRPPPNVVVNQTNMVEADHYRHRFPNNDDYDDAAPSDDDDDDDDGDDNEDDDSSISDDDFYDSKYEDMAYGDDEDDGAVGLNGYISRMDGFLFRKRNRKAMCVIGMGGIGKTFFAYKWFTSKKVKLSFHCHAWVHVSRNYNPRDVLASILDKIYLGDAPYALDEMDQTSLALAIRKYLTPKGRERHRFILVLDDVWDEDIWKIVYPALPLASHDCGRIIITTRQAQVAEACPRDIPCEVVKLKLFTRKKAWRLFCNKVSEGGVLVRRQRQKRGRREEIRPTVTFPDPAIQSLAQELLDQCRGLPLAIVILASAISRTDKMLSTWTNIHQLLLSRRRMNENYVNLFEILKYCYQCLQPRLRHAFLYCSLFPDDHEIEVNKLISLWVYDGFIVQDPTMSIKDTAMAYLMELIYRSMFQPVRIGLLGIVQSIKVHDLLRGIATSTILEGKLRELYTSELSLNDLARHARRISIMGSSTTTNTIFINDGIRSFVAWNVINLPSTLVQNLNSGRLQLLHALDVRGIKVTGPLLDHLGDLVHLRYLVLRCASIKVLPSSLSRLRYLQTFDIRDTQVKSLPSALIKLENLRSIHLASSFTRNVVEWPLPLLNKHTLQLQTLAGARATTKLVEELQHWTQLRKLSIGGVSGDDSEKICASISKMEFLGSFSIKCDGDETLQMQTLPSSMKDVHTLRIGGRVDQVAHVVRCFPSVRRLYLWDNYIKEQDPFSILQDLNNLVVLCLTNTYLGKEMRCGPNGFPNLKNLSILRMRNLETIIIDRGGMPNLKSLVIGHCKNLDDRHFKGLDSLKLEILKTQNMDKDFTNRMRQRYHYFKIHETPLFVYGSNPTREDE